MKKVFCSLLILTILLNAAVAQTPNWSENIASILYENCATCHRPGEIAPFSLLTYEDALINSYSIADQTAARKMPPYPADVTYCHYLDEQVLTDDQIATIQEWVDAGAPSGDTSLAPDVPVFPEGSQLGTPDTVLSMSQPYIIAGDGVDRYMVFVIPSDFTSGKNVSCIEFRPQNKQAVHHVFIYSDTTGTLADLDAQTPGYGFEGFSAGLSSADFLTLHRPGMNARFLPEGMAYNIPAGADIILQIHYAPLTYQTSDSSSVNIFFNDDDSVRTVLPLKVTEAKLTEPQFLIPANTITTFHLQSTTNQGDLSWIGISPHAHQLCSTFKVYAINPFGDTIPLVNIPQWDFNWQLLYNFTSLKKIENGSTLYAEATFDNTVNNPNNPNDPPIDVHYGLSSGDEMYRFFFNAVEYQEGDEFMMLDSSEFPTPVIPVEGIVNTPQLYSCYPNPSTDQITIEFFLPEKSGNSLTFFDDQGKIILLPASSSASPGFNRISVKTSSLASGIYHYRIVSGKNMRHKAFEVVR